MKITTDKTSTNSKTYKREDDLKPNWIYVDADECPVITDWTGRPIAAFDNNEVYSDTGITWPLRDTPITTITIKR